MRGVLVSGVASGVGKTTVALAIMAGLRRRGLTVQPFKCGPDFLDTGHHTRICGRKARNLDTWMLNEEANRSVLQNAARGADVLVAEGMMGLFDGKSGNTEAGSTAEIAKLLKLPVVLVVDAAKTARSIAAVVLGFEMFDPDLQLAGVILNRVATERHYEMLRAAIETSCKTKILGWLPRDPAIAIPERHLGLQGAAEAAMEDDVAIDTLAALAAKYFDLDRLLELQCGLERIENQDSCVKDSQPEELVRIGVPSDHAFSFYYEDNLDLLREQGAEIVPFSPLKDGSLPLGLDALYLGGGYPGASCRTIKQQSWDAERCSCFCCLRTARLCGVRWVDLSVRAAEHNRRRNVCDGWGASTHDSDDQQARSVWICHGRVYRRLPAWR